MLPRHDDIRGGSDTDSGAGMRSRHHSAAVHGTEDQSDLGSAGVRTPTSLSPTLVSTSTNEHKFHGSPKLALPAGSATRPGVSGAHRPHFPADASYDANDGIVLPLPIPVGGTSVIAGDDRDDAVDLSASDEQEPPLHLSLFPVCDFLTFPAPLNFVEVTKLLFSQFMNGALNQCLLFIGSTVIAMTVGKHGNEVTLASTSAGLSAMGVMAFSVAIGLAAALEGLCSQAYGRKDLVSVVRYTQVGIVVCLAVTSVLVGIIVLFGQAFLRVCFGELYVVGGYRFLLGALPFLVLIGPCSCLQKALQSTQRAARSTRATMLSALVTVATALVVIPHVSAENITLGAGLSWSASGVANLAALIYIIRSDGASKEGCPLLPAEPVSWTLADFAESCTVERVKEYVAVGSATYAAVAAEWLAFEALFLVCAPLGPAVMASLNVYFQMLSVAFSLPSGLCVSASSHIGRLLGANQPQEAVVFVRAVLCWSLMLPLVAGALIYAFHEEIFSLYTNESDRQKILFHLKSVLPIFCLTAVLDSFQYSVQAIYRGCNRAEDAVRIVLPSLWIVGLGGAFVLSRHYDFLGLSTGFAIGLGVEGPLLFRNLLLHFDFRAMARVAARERAEEERMEREAEAVQSTDATNIARDCELRPIVTPAPAGVTSAE